MSKMDRIISPSHGVLTRNDLKTIEMKRVNVWLLKLTSLISKTQTDEHAFQWNSLYSTFKNITKKYSETYKKRKKKTSVT